MSDVDLTYRVSVTERDNELSGDKVEDETKCYWNRQSGQCPIERYQQYDRQTQTLQHKHTKLFITYSVYCFYVWK